MNEIVIFFISFVCICSCYCCLKNINVNDINVNNNSVSLMRKRIKNRIKKMNEIVDTYNKDDESIIICPITQEAIEKGEVIKTLPCGHQFSDSIDEWIHEENECPVCRKNVIELV